MCVYTDLRIGSMLVQNSKKECVIGIESRLVCPVYLNFIIDSLQTNPVV